MYYEERYSNIRKATPTLAVAWTGHCFRILEIVSAKGRFITWSGRFTTRQDAERHIHEFLARRVS